MNVKKNIIICLLFIFIFPFINCGSDDKDIIKFKILCTGANFDGYYIVDGDDFPIENTQLVGTSTYKFEKTIKELDSLTVSATVNSGEDASITVYIYREEDLVDSCTLNVDKDEENRTLRCDYEYGDEEETSSD